MPQQRAIVIVPTYNEAENIGNLIQKVFETVPDISILVVDDNSPDGTGKIVDDLAAKYQNLDIIHREEKLGLGSAYRAGFRYAIDNGFDLVLEMDSDFSHDPKYVSQLLTLAEEYDVIIGSRYVPGGGTPDWEFKRRFLSRGANIFARFMLGLRFRDGTAGFRCYRRSALEAIGFDETRSNGYAFQVEILYRCRQEGLSICEHPIIFVDRRHGTSKLGRQELIEGAKTLLRLRAERKKAEAVVRTPIRRAMGAVLLAVALIAIAHSVYRSRHALPPIEGPRLLLSKTELNFGEVFADEALKEVIRVTNIGNEPLLISNARSSCRCVKPELLEKELLPKCSTDLNVEVVLDDYGKDSLNGKVYLQSNDQTTALSEVEVLAKIHPEYTVEPEEVDFGRVKRGQSPMLSLLVRQTGRQDLKLERVEAPPELSVSFTEVTSTNSGKRHSAAEAASRTYKVDVKIEPDVHTRRLNSALTLVTNIKRVPKYRVHVRAEMIGVECSITPRIVVFGPSHPGDKIGSIEVVGLNDIEVVEASCSAGDVELEVEEVEPDKRHVVMLQLDEHASQGEKVGKVFLKLKEGELVEVREVPFYGTVENRTDSSP